MLRRLMQILEIRRPKLNRGIPRIIIQITRSDFPVRLYFIGTCFVKKTNQVGHITHKLPSSQILTQEKNIGFTLSSNQSAFCILVMFCLRNIILIVLR